MSKAVVMATWWCTSIHNWPQTECTDYTINWFSTWRNPSLDQLITLFIESHGNSSGWDDDRSHDGFCSWFYSCEAHWMYRAFYLTVCNLSICLLSVCLSLSVCKLCLSLSVFKLFCYLSVICLSVQALSIWSLSSVVMETWWTTCRGTNTPSYRVTHTPKGQHTNTHKRYESNLSLSLFMLSVSVSCPAVTVMEVIWTWIKRRALSMSPCRSSTMPSPKPRCMRHHTHHQVTEKWRHAPPVFCLLCT